MSATVLLLAFAFTNGVAWTAVGDELDWPRPLSLLAIVVSSVAVVLLAEVLA